MTEHAIRHPKQEHGGGIRVLAIINMLIAGIVGIVTFLLGTMAASGNAGFEPVLLLAIAGGGYAIFGGIVGIKKAWSDTSTLRSTLFFQFSWVFVLALFVLALFNVGQD